MNSHSSPSRGSTGSGGGGTGRRTKKQVNDVTERLSHFTMECSSQLNKCASWLCKRSSGNLNERQRSPSADMIHHPTAMNASPAGSGVMDDDGPPARNCYRLIVLG